MMPDNLIVEEGTTVTLEDNPRGAGLEAAYQALHLETFNDLVKEGLVSSNESLEQMLTAAKKITHEALTSRDTFTPTVTVRGTALPDLRRFGGFTAGSLQATPSDRSNFWRFARVVSPTAVAKLDMDTKLSSVGLANMARIAKYLFRDVIVENNATLKVTGKSKLLSATNVLIKKGGRIVVSGGGLRIKAVSIQGQQ
jgi:hypothetical protein